MMICAVFLLSAPVFAQADAPPDTFSEVVLRVEGMT